MARIYVQNLNVVKEIEEINLAHWEDKGFKRIEASIKKSKAEAAAAAKAAAEAKAEAEAAEAEAAEAAKAEAEAAAAAAIGNMTK